VERKKKQGKRKRRTITPDRYLGHSQKQKKKKKRKRKRKSKWQSHLYNRHGPGDDNKI
jgi:hypothetical protein